MHPANDKRKSKSLWGKSIICGARALLRCSGHTACPDRFPLHNAAAKTTSLETLGLPIIPYRYSGAGLGIPSFWDWFCQPTSLVKAFSVLLGSKRSFHDFGFATRHVQFDLNLATTRSIRSFGFGPAFRIMVSGLPAIVISCCHFTRVSHHVSLALGTCTRVQEFIHLPTHRNC